jgi:Rps23 Pro-64 3,4-dihydroxylase Tpa1-like proline 4-hydroxylase
MCLYRLYMENFNIIDLVYTNKNSISHELCNDMINLFEREENRYAGHTASGLNKNIKDTTDFVITNGGTRWDKINKVLSKELNNNVIEYVKKYNNMVDPNYQIFGTNYLSTASMQLQKYEKNIGKYVYHEDSRCEFNDRKIRKLTFLWYLNDVHEGGETEFWSKHRIKPEAGKLVLFPACWTFPHRGNVPISNDKYIITGWLWQDYAK